MFFDIMRIMSNEHPLLFRCLLFSAFIIVVIIALYIRYLWKKRTGQWTTTMNYLKRDETWVGKRIIHATMTREEIDRAIDDFMDMYSTEENPVQRPVVSQDADGYTLTLPSTINYDLFCFWVNYLVYSDKNKRFNKQVTAWYEVPQDAKGAWSQFAGETLKFFIPESDDEFDNVYFTTKDNRCYKQEFAGSASLKPQEGVVRGQRSTHEIKKKRQIPVMPQLLFCVMGIAFVAFRTCSYVRNTYSTYSTDSTDSIFLYEERERTDVAKLLSEVDNTFVEYTVKNVATQNDPYVPSDTGKLSWAMRLISCGNAKALASMMKFPIPRKYPLHDIKDAEELSARFDEIFDRSFRSEMGRLKMSEWINCGYRGHCYGEHGDLWIYDELYLIDYYSPQERQRYEQLVKKEMSSLHDTLRAKGWRPYCCFKVDNGDIIRVDYAKRKKFSKENLHIDSIAMVSPQLQPIKLRGDEVFRMAIYTKGSDLHGKPSLIIYGKAMIGGSMSARDHQFTDEDGNLVTFGDPFYERNDLTLSSEAAISRKLHQPHSRERKLTPCYWLDLVK